MDMIVNDRAVDNLRMRAKTISRLRDFLDTRQFVEVETPVLASLAGGASAEPFKTHSRALQQDLTMRVAPELFLKQLVIGGMPRVYEIGKQFRNEGIDATHNPEFTTCEVYQAYSNVQDMYTLTQDVLRDLVMHINGAMAVQVKLSSGVDSIVDFTGDFKRIDITERLASILGPLPPLNDTCICA